MREILTSAGISLAIIAIGPRLATKALYDDRPPLVIWNMQPISTRLEPDAPYVYTFNYTKRAECYPPKGSGEVQHRLWHAGEGGFVHFTVIDNAAAFAPPAVNSFRKSTIPLPAALKPGHYAVQWRIEFRCDGASKMFEMIGPLMEFDVVAKPAAGWQQSTEKTARD